MNSGYILNIFIVLFGVLGSITMIDSDEVEISNLHRQVLHTEQDVGVPKVISAFEKLQRYIHSISR